MQVQKFAGRMEKLLFRLMEGSVKPGLYRPDKSWMLLEVSDSKVNYVYYGRPNAFPRKVEWKYTIGEVDLSSTKKDVQVDYARIYVLAESLQAALRENRLPAKEIKVKKSISSLEFTETAVQNQIKTIQSLRSVTGYENTIIKYKDTSANSQGIKLEVSTKGKASYYITYRLKDENGNWSNESAKVVGNAKTDSIEQARQRAIYLQDNFINKNKPTPSTHIFENRAVKTFRDLHELQVRGERGKSLNPSSIAEYDRIAFNYLGSKNDYLEYRKKRNAESIRPNKKHRDQYIGLGILDRDFDTLTFLEARQLHAQLRKAVIKNKARLKQVSTGRQADKVFTYLRTLIDKGNLLMQEQEPSWNMRNPILLFSKEKVWVNPGGNSVRKDKTLPDQSYPNMWRGIQELRSYRLETSAENANKRNTKTDVRSYKLNSYFYEFLLYTGFRPEDAVRIEWSQIDLKQGSITWRGSQRQGIKNHAGIGDEHFVLYLNQQALNVVKALHNLYQQFRQEIAAPFDVLIEKAKADKASNKTIKSLEQKRDAELEKLACNQYLLCNAYLNNKMKQNPTIFIDKLEGLTDLRVTAGAFRAMFQQKAAEVGLKDYEIKRLVFHKMNVNKSDVQAGYNMTSSTYLKRISQKVANKLAALCNAEFEQETFMLIDSSTAKKIYAALDLDHDSPESPVELMTDDEYKAYVEAEQRTIEEHAQLILEDFLTLMKDPSAKAAFNNLNHYKKRHYKLH
ncbi:TPA: hypothetical protein NJ358_005356 [Vibrio parahaemolyticus]|nr:hypothetical protein [Vibrio parahaemolyticus]HCG7284482.1 hypothetical protein [Vibrio parahaemolyticus]